VKGILKWPLIIAAVVVVLRVVVEQAGAPGVVANVLSVVALHYLYWPGLLCNPDFKEWDTAPVHDAIQAHYVVCRIDSRHGVAHVLGRPRLRMAAATVLWSRGSGRHALHRLHCDSFHNGRILDCRVSYLWRSPRFRNHCDHEPRSSPPRNFL
jgi:hypothetical protein